MQNRSHSIVVLFNESISMSFIDEVEEACFEYLHYGAHQMIMKIIIIFIILFREIGNGPFLL